MEEEIWMALEKGTEEFMMFGEYFNFCKKYWKVEDNDNYWEKLIEEADSFIKKYKEIGLARKIIKSFCDQKEEEYKQLKNNK